jgi:hypothetical protein
MPTIRASKKQPPMTRANAMPAVNTVWLGPPLAKADMDQIRYQLGRAWVDACMAHECATGLRPARIVVGHTSRRILSVKVVA